MAAAVSPFFRDDSFDPFLFSSIGEERNGMLLSVVSALARLDLDPWREAASLSRLTATAAAERLTCLLKSMPATQIETPAPATIQRLVTLLPKTTPHPAWAPIAAAPSKISWPLAALIALAVLALCAQPWATRRGGEAPGLSAPASGAGATRVP